MRTTIDVPDEVLRRAKIVAIERGSTLKQLVIDALTHEIESPRGKLRRRLSAAPVKLAEDSPLRTLSPEEIKRLDTEEEAAADEAGANAIRR